MVCEDQDILVVHRPKGKSVVLMSLDDYNSIQETNYLLSTKITEKDCLMHSKI
jgi:antitoxin YefM